MRRGRMRRRGLRRMTPGVAGVGIGWRQEIDLTVDRFRRSAVGPGVDFVEVVAENIHPGHIPATLLILNESGVPVIPHGVSLSLGGADPLDPVTLDRLAALAQAFGSPLVSEHVAFCRAGGIEAGQVRVRPRLRGPARRPAHHLAKAAVPGHLPARRRARASSRSHGPLARRDPA